MINASLFFGDDVINREIVKMLAYAGDRMRLQNACVWAKNRFEETFPHLTRESNWWERLANCHVKYHENTVSVAIRDLSAE